MSELISLQNEKNGYYLLCGKLDRDTVPLFWQNKENWLPQDTDVVVDLSKLSRVDSAGMAMLLHWQQHTVLEEKKIAFAHIPFQLKTLLQLSNIEKLLNCI